ncbi:MAG TPA: conjugal transfer protein TrbC [Kribbella sp.]
MLTRAIVLMAPKGSTPPPGVADKFQTLLDWVTWIAFSVCILGVVIAGAMMAMGQRRGEGGEHAARLGWVLAACIVIGSSSMLVKGLGG